MAQITSQIVARSGRHHLRSLRMDGAALVKIEVKKVATDNWSSTLFGGEKIYEDVLKLCKFQRLNGRLKPFLSRSSSTKSWPAQGVLLGTVRYDALLG